MTHGGHKPRSPQWARDISRAAGLLLLLIFALPLPTRAQDAGLYFGSTGHTLTDQAGFLGFWQTNDGTRLLGAPISEIIETPAGLAQYFERARLEQRIDASGAAVVVPGDVAAEYATALGKQFAPAPPRRPSKNERLVEATGHVIRPPFLAFYDEVGGAALFGDPISEAIWERTADGSRRVQYFTRARLVHNPDRVGTPNVVAVSDLGRALALLAGQTMAPIENPGYTVIESLIGAAPVAFNGVAPTPVPPTATPVPPRPTAAPRPATGAPAAPAAAAPRPRGTKSIVVSISDQWLYAYEGDTIVFDAPVATGRDGNNTPTGSYAIYAKLPVQTMDGTINGEYYRVPNVPSVMYINGGVALHGTYWHNLFGSGVRPSHGCINLPVRAAAWLYGWAPVGTTVRVRG